MNEELAVLLRRYLGMNNYGDFILISVANFVIDILLRDMNDIIGDIVDYDCIFSDTILYVSDCYNPKGKLPSKMIKEINENDSSLISQFKKYEINRIYVQTYDYYDYTADDEVFGTPVVLSTEPPEPIEPCSISLKDLRIIAYDLERILNNNLLPKEIDIRERKPNKSQQMAKTQRGENGLLATIGLLTELLLGCKKENGRAIYGNKQALLNTIAEMDIPTQSQENLNKRLRYAEKALNDVRKLK